MVAGKSKGGLLAEAAQGDRALVRRMLGGDERAFEEFFETHFSRVYRFAMTRLGGDAVAAEEVAQATLCQAISRLVTWRGESALFTWLCTICRHEIGHLYRRRGRFPDPAGLIEDSPECWAALGSLAAALEEGPEARFARKEVARLVQVTLDNLPWSYASALEWKYIHGLPVKEIAGKLNLGLKAAESLLVRARTAFREAFSTLTGPTDRIVPAEGSRRTETS